MIANAGTYDITGNVITTRAMVAKNPRLMKPETREAFSYRFEDKTLWLTQTRNENGPTTNPPSRKLVRLE